VTNKSSLETRGLKQNKTKQKEVINREVNSELENRDEKLLQLESKVKHAYKKINIVP
jgi:hypothetical protein